MNRYGMPAQQVIAWLGVLMKLLDIGAKWASIGILMEGFTGLPVWQGIVLAGLVSMVYITIGGLWADLLTDFVQFGVQLVAGIVIAVGVAGALSDRGLNYLTMWEPLNEVQPGFSDPFSGEYTMLWAALYLFAKTFESTAATGTSPRASSPPPRARTPVRHRCCPRCSTWCGRC